MCHFCRKCLTGSYGSEKISEREQNLDFPETGHLRADFVSRLVLPHPSLAPIPSILGSYKVRLNSLLYKTNTLYTADKARFRLL